MASWKKTTKSKAKKAIKKTVKKVNDATVESAAAQEQGTDNSMVATWTCSRAQSQIDHFEFEWQYYTNKNGWINGGSSSVQPRLVSGNKYGTTFTCSNSSAVWVRYRTLAVAKKHKVSKSYYETQSVYDKKKKKNVKKKVKKTLTEEVAYFTDGWGGWSPQVKAPAAVAADVHRVSVPDAPGDPRAELQSNGRPLVSWAEVPDNATDIWVRRYQDGNWNNHTDVGKQLAPSAREFVDNGAQVGHYYRYATIARNTRANGSGFGARSGLSDSLVMAPAAPSALKASAASSTSAYLEWIDSLFTGDSYLIYHADTRAEAADPDAYGISGTSYESTPQNGKNHYTVTGLTPGGTVWFSVRRVSDGGSSAVCAPASCVLGTVADAPTPVEQSVAVFVGDTLTLEWVHNCEDGSDQTWRHVVAEASTDGLSWSTIADVSGSTAETTYDIDTTSMADGTRIRWRVRTKGAYTAYTSDEQARWRWSRTVEVRVWVKPSMTVLAKSVTADGEDATNGTLARLPLVAVLTTGVDATSQRAVEWSLRIDLKEATTYVNDWGENDWMQAGTTVWSAYIDDSDEGFGDETMAVTIPASEAAFVVGSEYRMVAQAVMDSGLVTDEAECEFLCSWTSTLPAPSAALIATDDFACAIYPSCITWDEEDGVPVPMVDDGGNPVRETDVGEYVFDPVTGEGSYDGHDGEPMSFDDGTPIYACACRLTEGVTLSVWRIEPDGLLTEIATGVPNTGSVAVTDAHPSFGTCWYRIVANDSATDEVRVLDQSVDMPYEMLLIQWDERTVAISDSNSEEVTYDGSMLQLPYNIKTTETWDKDVAEVEYIGRSHPVSYYGTQVGQRAKWRSVVVPREDVEDLDALRRLAVHMGDCYVREPTGTGYWAHVEVEGIEQSFDSAVADVSISIARVDHEDEGEVS